MTTSDGNSVYINLIFFFLGCIVQIFWKKGYFFLHEVSQDLYILGGLIPPTTKRHCASSSKTKSIPDFDLQKKIHGTKHDGIDGKQTCSGWGHHLLLNHHLGVAIILPRMDGSHKESPNSSG